MTILNDLPPEHQLRNAPLIEIGARYRWMRSNTWRTVMPNYKIANKTFNQLGPAWTYNDMWEATILP